MTHASYSYERLPDGDALIYEGQVVRCRVMPADVLDQVGIAAMDEAERQGFLRGLIVGAASGVPVFQALEGARFEDAPPYPWRPPADGEG